jgi:hypothetical protein
VGLVRKHCQGLDHAHIDLIKSVAPLTKNKDVFLCIPHYHCSCGLVQQYEQMLEDMVDDNYPESRPIEMNQAR